MSYLDRFVDAYVECALWASTDDTGEPMDDTFGPEDIAPTTLEEMRRECASFVDYAGDALTGIDAEQAGHDFWLTRNGHGAGFWDRGLGDVGDVLTDKAHSFGSSDLYVGDDGKVYAS